jgi:large subunit ribosomal protein L13
MKTYSAKKKDIKRGWHIFDAKGEVLGRLSTKIVTKLMGKEKVNYTPNMDNGDYVVVVNAQDIVVTGRKDKKKLYQWHTGFPKGFRELTFNQMMDKDPRKVLRFSISGMLPKNKLRDKRLARLKLFNGIEHSYTDKFKK